MTDPDFGTGGQGSNVSNASNASNTAGGSGFHSVQRSNSQSSQSSVHKSGHRAHRQSFVENQRHPPSPRSQRHASMTQQAVQDLLSHPPVNRQAKSRYAGKDWRTIALGDLIVPEQLKWVSLDASVEDATHLLIKNEPANVVLVREHSASTAAVSTFDYNDLNTYLLVVLGLLEPEEEHQTLFSNLAVKAQTQKAIQLQEIRPLCRKEELTVLPADSTLDKAIEAFGGGIHSILMTDRTCNILGVLTQLRLLDFFWNEAINFPEIDRLYACPLRDLRIGTKQAIAINADAPLSDALLLMNNEGLSSVAVVDNALNVVGNISTADVRHLTNTTSLPLLKSSCIHFISLILSERGMARGRDSFPVFYVSPFSTLAHTVAKLVATCSHRMWVVESASPSPSAPATPLLQPREPSSLTGSTPSLGTGIGSAQVATGPTVVSPSTTATPQSPFLNQAFPCTPAASMPGAHISGRLTGVISLTDILNLLARSSGLNPSDPSEQRARRRRSSSSSLRPSVESGRQSTDLRR